MRPTIGKLAYVSTVFLSSVAALDLLAPGHSLPEMLVVPENLTIMTPREGKPVFEQQIFDFGSAQSGFSELRRVFERQACPSGYGTCPNDSGVCCPLGGRCCGAGRCCGSGRWCYAGGCCLTTQDGCDDTGCCTKGSQCCRGGRCCPSGNNCVIVDGKLGCCPIGQTCTSGPTCTRTGYSPCRGENFCCPTGNICYRDNGQPMCRDPSQQISSTTPLEPSTSYTPPEPSTTSTPEPTEPGTSTASVAVSSITYVIESPAPTSNTPPLYTTTPRASTIRAGTTSTSTPRSTATNAALSSSSSTTNVGAIAGGVVAGVLAIAALILALIIWRRRQGNNAAATATNEPEPYPSSNQAPYNPGPVPPTPGTADPFLTPMSQNPNLAGVTYFGPNPASPGPSGTGSNATQYTGLPEPQQSDYTSAGAVVGMASMPSPRRDGHQPRPLPMTVTSMQGGNSSTRWSGYPDSTPSSGLNAAGYAGYPEVDSNNSQPRWSTPVSPNMTQPDRAPSTVYQPSSHDGGYDQTYSPPQSPPPPPPPPPPHSAYGGMAPSAGPSGLPSGAAPPVSNFAPGEKQVYRPY